jgi:hypothetical protein
MNIVVRSSFSDSISVSPPPPSTNDVGVTTRHRLLSTPRRHWVIASSPPFRHPVSLWPMSHAQRLPHSSLFIFPRTKPSLDYCVTGAGRANTPAPRAWRAPCRGPLHRFCHWTRPAVLGLDPLWAQHGAQCFKSFFIVLNTRNSCQLPKLLEIRRSVQKHWSKFCMNPLE